MMNLTILSQGIKKRDSIKVAISTLRDMAATEKQLNKSLANFKAAFSKKSMLFNNEISQNLSIFNSLQINNAEKKAEKKVAKKLNKKLQKKPSEKIIYVVVAFGLGILTNNAIRNYAAK